ncbi:MAG: STAS/SEC14 domain-containing protein [Dissulfurispiraceae bacterium]
MIEIIPDMPDVVVAVSAKGTVTGEDYENVLVPAIEERLKRHQKIRLLYELGREFSGFTAAAMWDDAKVGMKHLTAFEKIAVVSDVDWIVGAVRIFAFVILCPVRVFPNDRLSEAKNWVSL